MPETAPPEAPALPEPPRAPMEHFIDIVLALRAAPLLPVQALYLVWNQDLSERSAPGAAEITELARTLRAGFADVESDFVAAPDPSGERAPA